MTDKITVVLLDKDGISQHASGKLDPDKIENCNSLKRNERLYTFWRLSSNTYFYIETDHFPYVITEF